MQCLWHAACALIAFSIPAVAAEDAKYETERGHLMCTSPQSFKDAQRAVETRDKEWLASIQECRQSTGGLKAEIVQGGTLTVKIRVYDDHGEPTIYWTSPTTLKEGRR